MPSNLRSRPISYLVKFLVFILIYALVTMLGRALFSRFVSGGVGFPRDLSEAARQAASSLESLRRVVVLDAGHGGEDGGTSSESGTLEKDLNLTLAMLLAEQLRAAGVTVVLTRDSDRLLYDPLSDYRGRKKILDQRERLRIAEEAARADPNAEVLFVSLHMNSYPSPSVRGLQVWYSENHAESERLALAVKESATTLLGPIHERNARRAEGAIYLLDRLTLPAILIECGFLSSPEDAKLLENEEYRRTLAFAICTAILNYEAASL